MRNFLVVMATVLVLQSCAKQHTKTAYLEANRFDINATDFEFPEQDFNLLGFGAYHGSAETEHTELALLTSLTKSVNLKYYLPEVDYSTAHFYNHFLQNGDTLLLKELIVYNGYHVPQERTIEMYEKWKNLKKLNDKLPKHKKLQVLGIEWINNYKFVAKHLSTMINVEDSIPKPIIDIQKMVAVDTTYYQLGKTSYAGKLLSNLITDYKLNPSAYHSKIENIAEFDYLIKNIKISFEEQRDREQIIFENYLSLDSLYNFKNNKQLMRIGFFHLEKSREGSNGNPSLFTKLLESNSYNNKQLLSIIGYFSDSRVVWDEIYENGAYKTYTTEGGYGIGDYDKEYFRGIQHLKDTKLSDKTLFRLNQDNTPYANNEPDLIEVIMEDQESNTKRVKGMSTTDFIDYAILISNSKASTPIYEMK